MDEFEIFGVLYLLGQHAVIHKNGKIIKRRKLKKKKRQGKSVGYSWLQKKTRTEI
jgi:hypothetical protein